MKLNTLEDLLHRLDASCAWSCLPVRSIEPNGVLVDAMGSELKDLYSAENQLVKGLPKMAKAASNEELKAGFEEHLERSYRAARSNCGADPRKARWS
jgi:Domain of unknown function (DUF892)